ncbi:hypothetical protein T07_2354 [Trichinella nelsoni]|uniref:Uncharacterized protein n=1 Tax=Trichinella nelsoni TaxID=6336 RepID=A0A0V0RKK4_9BILA|nr:hypothetical protein T07_2354 [Trichinella nelsoni]
MRLVFISLTTLKLWGSQTDYRRPEFQIYFNVVCDFCVFCFFAHNETLMIFCQASDSRVSPTKWST